MIWVISATASRLGIKAVGISGPVSDDSDDVAESVLTPILVTLESGFEYSS